MSVQWLPQGRQAAVCFSIDDVHPTAADGEHGCGDVSHQVLDRLAALLDRHPSLRVTLFTTPDWRARAVNADAAPLRRLPVLNRCTYAARPHPRGTLRLDRHQGVALRLAAMPRAEVALHGLHHVRRGLAPAAECKGLGIRRSRRLLAAGRAIMSRARIGIVPGFAAPAWDAPDALLAAMGSAGFRFIASARDLESPVSRGMLARGSGRRDVALYAPDLLEPYRLVHIPTNYQATSSIDRALAIIDQGGLLSVKAHFLGRLGSYVALDALDDRYVAQLDALFALLDRRYGTALWWPSLSELSEHVHAVAAWEHSRA